MPEVQIEHDIPLVSTMSEYYVLERLTADGSKRAARMLKELEDRYAIRLARYMTYIVGGELRHIGRDLQDDCSCRCRCEGCKDYSCYHDQSCWEYADCPDCSDPKYCDTMPLEEHEVWDEGGNCAQDHEYDIDCCCANCCGCCEGHSIDLDEYRFCLSSEMRDFLEENRDYNGSSRGWASEAFLEWATDSGKWGQLMREAYKAFVEIPWAGGYGGDAWGTVARMTADYLDGKLSAHLFLDRCWTVQHNGGAVFDKSWDYEALKELKYLLDAQAQSKYGRLAKWCRREISQLWQARDYYLNRLDDRSDMWRGVQLTWNPEDVPWE